MNDFGHMKGVCTCVWTAHLGAVLSPWTPNHPWDRQTMQHITHWTAVQEQACTARHVRCPVYETSIHVSGQPLGVEWRPLDLADGWEAIVHAHHPARMQGLICPAKAEHLAQTACSSVTSIKRCVHRDEHGITRSQPSDTPALPLMQRGGALR